MRLYGRRALHADSCHWQWPRRPQVSGIRHQASGIRHTGPGNKIDTGAAAKPGAAADRAVKRKHAKYNKSYVGSKVIMLAFETGGYTDATRLLLSQLTTAWLKPRSVHSFFKPLPFCVLRRQVAIHVSCAER